MLGASIASELIQRGCDVRTFSRRDPRSHPLLAGKNFESVRGDLSNLDDVTKAVSGCTRVFHVAGMVSYKVSDAEALIASNVIGTQNLLSAARLAAVDRVVVTGSTAALGLPKRGDQILDERSQPDSRDLAIGYIATKHAAEQQALSEREVDVIVASPATIYGIGDISLNTGLLFKYIREGRIACIPSGGLGVVSLRDCVSGHLLAMERGTPGQKYLLCASNHTYSELFAAIAESLGVAGPRFLAPQLLYRPLRLIGTMVDGMMTICGKQTMLRNTVTLAFSRRFYSGDKARRELGWIPSQDLPSMIREAAAFYMEHSLI